MRFIWPSRTFKTFKNINIFSFGIWNATGFKFIYLLVFRIGIILKLNEENDSLVKAEFYKYLAQIVSNKSSTAVFKHLIKIIDNFYYSLNKGPVQIGGGVTDTQKEQEKAEKDEKEDRYDDDLLKEQREWDEFKDDHKRGSGNRFNRSWTEILIQKNRKILL